MRSSQCTWEKHILPSKLLLTVVIGSATISAYMRKKLPDKVDSGMVEASFHVMVIASLSVSSSIL